MKIATFKVEEWMNLNETKAKYNIAETCVDSVTLDELFRLAGRDRREFFETLAQRRMTYGAIFGADELKTAISGLYRSVGTEEIITTHGAAGANHLALYSLVEPGDAVVSVMPTYQQLYSIPESYGAKVRILKLKKEENFLPNLDRLRTLVNEKTKIICINNPNNPTGALIPEETLRGIVEIARGVGAYVLCDEVYRFLTQEDGYPESIADLYEKGIAVGSMSKVFSLAGLRLGWIATRSKEAMREILLHRDYDTISCGMIDEALAAIALEAKEALIGRNRGIVKENLAVLDAWVAKEPRFSYVKPQCGTTALLYCDVDMPSEEFCSKLLVETGAFLTPGSCFDEEHCFRIGYACNKRELEEGLAKLSEFVKELA
ncbi:aminotransferase [uncultured Cloacibacillus sp.]|uniref:aminotransferase n=1 Tax=uncultured Cloacibacillus sp. TaxID=889794 RepID=UPI0027D9801E|nr:aminotransferase [uncultured Cloacibacillus sp.]